MVRNDSDSDDDLWKRHDGWEKSKTSKKKVVRRKVRKKGRKKKVKKGGKKSRRRKIVPFFTLTGN